MKKKLCTLMFCALILKVTSLENQCHIPEILRGSWFSVEDGKDTITKFDERFMTIENRVKVLCDYKKTEHNSDYTIAFQYDRCYHCIKFFVRTINIVEKIEGVCTNISNSSKEDFDSLCSKLNHNKITTLFSNDHYNRGLVNCKTSLQGSWDFAYERPGQFSGRCSNPKSRIHSCLVPDKLSLSNNQKFTMAYQKCEGKDATFQGMVEYGCFGDWYRGDKHYFAVYNTKESRKAEAYKCFIKNDTNDSILGISLTAECNTLNSPTESPEVVYLSPIKQNSIEAGCKLPQIISGDWIDSVNIDAKIFINQTHIAETDTINGKIMTTDYICQEQRDNIFVMARYSVTGCPNDYVCFEFVKNEDNIITYKRGKPTVHHQFDRACSFPFFETGKNTTHNYYFRRNPKPNKCPFKGKYTFTQKGDVPFEVRNPKTITPDQEVKCKNTFSEFRVSDAQTEILITKKSCSPGEENKIINEPDYVFKCISYWTENEKSYLLTYDESDPVYQYRCWVYGEHGNKISISQAIGSSCSIKQTMTSQSYTEQAAVALSLQKTDL
ncbi:unnamed protein product [Diabrotica balteata]|uniref:Uncharacterized protein n=1 Tax=Diabrotica balteata TaxID=107213 RepID=A0A9N9T039_DIABA|nr:unnamed protein product [Diabrotica balteata]